MKEIMSFRIGSATFAFANTWFDPKRADFGFMTMVVNQSHKLTQKTILLSFRFLSAYNAFPLKRKGHGANPCGSTKNTLP